MHKLQDPQWVRPSVHLLSVSVNANESLLRCRMQEKSESVMVAYTHNYAKF